MLNFKIKPYPYNHKAINPFNGSNRPDLMPYPYNRPTLSPPRLDEDLENERVEFMKKGGRKKKRLNRKSTKTASNINIKLNINVGDKKTKKRISSPRKSETNKVDGFKGEDTPLKKADFIKLLSRSELPELKPVYTGGNIRLLQNPTVFGGTIPRPLAPSSYSIPTTINNPIRGTYQTEYKETPKSIDTPGKSDLKKIFEESFKEFEEQRMKKELKLSPGNESEEEEKDIQREPKSKTKQRKISLSTQDWTSLYNILRQNGEIESIKGWQKLDITEKAEKINEFDKDLEEIYKSFKYPSEAGEIVGQKYKLKDSDIPEKVYNKWKELKSNPLEEEEEEEED
jgi:hypothetical protein